MSKKVLGLDPSQAATHCCLRGTLYIRLAHLCGRRRTDLNRDRELARQAVALRLDDVTVPVLIGVKDDLSLGRSLRSDGDS